MYTIKIQLIITVSLLIGLVFPAYSESLQLLDEIEHTAYVYSLAEAQARYDNPQISVESLDSRLRLQTCEHPLTAFSNSDNVSLGSQAIGIKCDAPVAWTVYVPVKIKVFKPIVVAARGLDAKQIITENDIRLEQQDIAKMRRGYIEKIESVVGQQLKYPVAVGAVINPNSLFEQKVVHRGEQIMLVATIGKMEVRMAGTALADGEQGERVRVKNASSHRVVEGVVDGPGIVRVSM
ncbi:MAG: flagellar basal body P-ring formation chaperone FlgA [Gammaproteobacteria bacterium]|nr:flagellar basal body P-ring formation chaperone FlgA [Gammaproteobacteria bacterium]